MPCAKLARLSSAVAGACQRDSWQWLLDSELRNAGGAMPWSVLRNRMVRRHIADAGHQEPFDVVQAFALAIIPAGYLSSVDNLVRLPPTDEEIVQARKRLQYHCEKFHAYRDKQALIEIYKRELAVWKRQQDTATIMRHAVHVSAWVAFANTMVHGCDGLPALVSLLHDMLVALGNKYPTPRLNVSLRHVADRLGDTIVDSGDAEWLSTSLARVNKLLGRVPPAGGQAQGVQTPHRRCPVRTDVQFVRSVLGSQRPLPPGYKIRSQAGRMQNGSWRSTRWFGSLRGKRLTGSNAATSRFTDEDAINHVYSFILRHRAREQRQ